LSRALNIAYEGEETGGWRRRILVEIGMVTAVTVLLLCALSSDYLLLLLWDAVQWLPGQAAWTFRIIRQMAPTLLLLGAFYLIYRFVPRKRSHWKSLLAGALVATFLFRAAQSLFADYVQNMAHYNVMYGGIGVAVVLLVWAWVAAFIALFGGQIVAHFQPRALEEETPENVGPESRRSRGVGEQGKPSGDAM